MYSSESRSEYAEYVQEGFSVRTLIRKFARKSTRRYAVQGSILFQTTLANQEEGLPAREPRHLRWLIQQADTAMPWRDQHDYSGRQMGSLCFLGDPVQERPVLYSHEVTIQFLICPEYPTLRENQVFAYQRYLENLGKTLRRIVPGSYSIQITFTVSSTWRG